MKINRKNLLAQKQRAWDKNSTYDKIYIVPTRRKHDSGYMVMAIVGVTQLKTKIRYEIAGYCDDICWKFQGLNSLDLEWAVRTDCEYPSGIIRFWSNYCKFEVGCSLSSTDICLIRK